MGLSVSLSVVGPGLAGIVKIGLVGGSKKFSLILIYFVVVDNYARVIVSLLVCK